MVPRSKLLFPEAMYWTFGQIKELRSRKDEWRYTFMSDEEYSKIIDLPEAARIYWTEMLARAHIVALTSMFRTARWFESLEKLHSNYHGFCASLRGLVESVADSFYTLQQFPLTTAIDFQVIRKQIDKTAVIITFHETLESELLHYIQATNIPSEMKKSVPKHYNAKKVVDYLDSFTRDSGILLLYDYLCGVAHPAYESGRVFLFLYNGETIVCNDSQELERQMIRKLLTDFHPTIEQMFRVYMNNILSTTTLLNDFGIPLFMTELSGEKDFRVTEIWKEVESLKEQSIAKYQKAESTGKYE
jgi:hypothetical protein